MEVLASCNIKNGILVTQKSEGFLHCFFLEETIKSYKTSYVIQEIILWNHGGSGHQILKFNEEFLLQNVAPKPVEEF
jgi:hypothetical protein